MAETKTIPTAAEIDQLAADYVNAQVEADGFAEIAAAKKQKLADLVAKKGFTPARATKSLRLEGDRWKCTLSQSDSLEIDGTETERFSAMLKFLGVPHLFWLLFRRRNVYVLNPKAQQILERYCVRGKYAAKAEKIRAAFNRCLQIKSSAPGLKVEPMEKEKEAKAS